MKILYANRIALVGTPRSVCLCPIKGTPGLNELKIHIFCTPQFSQVYNHGVYSLSLYNLVSSRYKQVPVVVL